MLNITLIKDVDLEPEIIDNVDIDLAIKYGVLFTKINNIICTVVNSENLSKSFTYLSKLDIDYKLVQMDNDSFARLNRKFLEIRSDESFDNMEQDKDHSDDEDDIDLVDFLQNSADILTSEESAPIIKFVNSLFYQAVKKKASDIHIETHEFKGEVRFRVDGVLVKHLDLNRKIANLIISRIKVISNLDIAEKRVPQDGRTQIKIAGVTLDIRVSSLPTYYGERIVMRILMQSDDIPTLEDLGFEENEIAIFRELLKHSNGLLLVTGPTGSGKSTTLHTFLQEVASPYKNIITVEDPVEYKADNINQIQVNTKVGLTFSSGLRSILRQDPDVIMIGEIRDSETAEIAVQSALTGHLVLSTLHTNNSTASIARLVDMKVENFLIGSSLLGVLAQRLVRTLCECKEEDFIAEEYANEFDLPLNSKIFKPKGCIKCNFTGYSGRKAVGEIFVIDDDVQSLIKDTSDDYQIRALMAKKGMNFLSDKLKTLLLNHTTSLEEVIRVGIKDS